MKPVGLKSVNPSAYHKNAELKEKIEALEREISNLQKMSLGESAIETELESKAKELIALQQEFSESD